MGPVARIGSVLTFTMAAGALSTRANSNIMSEPVLDPLPKGNASTFPATLCLKRSWRKSIIRPVAGSTPPQKLMGCEVTSTSPFAIPGTTQQPVISSATVLPFAGFFLERLLLHTLQYFHRLRQGLSGKSSSWQTWRNRSWRRQTASSPGDIAVDIRR